MLFFVVILMMSFSYAQQSNGNLRLSAEAAFQMVECFKEYDYHRQLSPLRFDVMKVQMDMQISLNKNGKLSEAEKQTLFQQFIEPYFRMTQDLDACASKNKKLFQLRADVFGESEVTNWMATMRADFQNEHPNSELSVKLWRRSMIPYGLMAKNFELLFAHTLANKLLKKLMMPRNQIHGLMRSAERSLKNLKWMVRRLALELDSTRNALIHTSVLHKFEAFSEYSKMYSELRKSLAKVVLSEAKGHIRFDLPRVKRVIWFVRHSERLDNTGDRKDMVENPLLSKNGERLAARLNTVFKHIPVSQLYSSPLLRCVQTSDFLLGGEQQQSSVKINLEPGFFETFVVCGKDSFDDCEETRRERDSWEKKINCQYTQKVPRAELGEYETEQRKYQDTDTGSVPIVKKVLTGILRELNAQKIGGQEKTANEPLEKEREKWMAPGEEEAEHIVIVGHACVGAALQQLSDAKFVTTPQTSITKLVELAAEVEQNTQQLHGHGENGQNKENKMGNEDDDAKILANIRLIFNGETSHSIQKGEDTANLFRFK